MAHRAIQNGDLYFVVSGDIYDTNTDIEINKVWKPRTKLSGESMTFMMMDGGEIVDELQER